MAEQVTEFDQVGICAPRCPRCGWQAVDRLDDTEGRKAARVDVVAHLAGCRPERCRACREGIPAEVAPCLCVIPTGHPTDHTPRAEQGGES